MIPSVLLLLAGSAALCASQQAQECIPEVDTVSGLYNLVPGGQTSYGTDLKACSNSDPANGRSPREWGGNCAAHLKDRIGSTAQLSIDKQTEIPFPIVYRCISDASGIWLWRKQLNCDKGNIGKNSSNVQASTSRRGLHERGEQASDPNIMPMPRSINRSLKEWCCGTYKKGGETATCDNLFDPPKPQSVTTTVSSIVTSVVTQQKVITRTKNGKVRTITRDQVKTIDVYVHSAGSTTKCKKCESSRTTTRKKTTTRDEKVRRTA